MAEAFEVAATVKHIPMTPQKVRLVVDVVRGLNAQVALDTLRFMPHKAAEPVFKLIQSAVANAEQNFGLDVDELVVSRIYANEGPRNSLRPYGGRFGGRGRFKPVVRRTSHITVVLTEHSPVDFGA